ncbi:MAG: hypothetical protein U1G08_12705 [Verrucomicrobiota bacterium]
MEASAPPPQPSPSVSPESPRPKSKGTLYAALGILVIPGLFALTGKPDLASLGALLLAPLCSLISGIILGIRIGETPGTRFLLSCGLVVACFAVAEGLAVAGCGISNPKFNFH